MCQIMPCIKLPNQYETEQILLFGKRGVEGVTPGLTDKRRGKPLMQAITRP
jgi:hypothetical protein